MIFSRVHRYLCVLRPSQELSVAIAAKHEASTRLTAAKKEAAFVEVEAASERAKSARLGLSSSSAPASVVSSSLSSSASQLGGALPTVHEAQSAATGEDDENASGLGLGGGSAGVDLLVSARPAAATTTSASASYGEEDDAVASAAASLRALLNDVQAQAAQVASLVAARQHPARAAASESNSVNTSDASSLSALLHAQDRHVANEGAKLKQSLLLSGRDQDVAANLLLRADVAATATGRNSISANANATLASAQELLTSIRPATGK